MVEKTAALKDCPSCGSQITETSTRCEFCKSALGKCEGCRGWIVVGTRCFDCGKSTSVRVREALKQVKEADPFEFAGSGVSLALPVAIRFVLFAAFVAAIVMGVAAFGVEPVGKFLAEYGVQPKVEWPVFAGAAGGLFVLLGVAGSLLHRTRMGNTLVYGNAVEVRTSVGSIVANIVISLLVLGLTAGLGLPWLYSRYRRSFYRSCVLPRRGGRNLDFRGAGEEVLGRFCLTLLLLPLAIGTAGLLFPVISWMWLKWEHSNLIVPDKNGQYHPARFTGTFGAFFGCALLGWLITIVTGGLARPWAKAAELKWFARNTQVA